MRTDKERPNKTSRLVLFDIDQTLIDSGGAGRRALYRALQETLLISLDGLELANISMSGKTDPQIIWEFILASKVENISESEIDRRQIIDQILSLYLKFLPEEINQVAKTPQCFVYDGVMEILQLLENDKRIALGLLTGNIKSGAQIKLEQFNLNRFFPIGAYGCDSANRLELPAIAHKRAQEHYSIELTPSQITIIGDAQNDILCAKHYGAISIAVNTGTTTWQELSALEPNYIFSSLKDTREILSAIVPEAGRVVI